MINKHVQCISHALISIPQNFKKLSILLNFQYDHNSDNLLYTVGYLGIKMAAVLCVNYHLTNKC